MNKSKHTQGKWKVEPFKDYDKHIVISGGLAVVNNDDVDHKEAKANAYLIAASPNLLAACKSFVHWYESDSSEFNRDGAFERAKEAIANAEEGGIR